MKNVGVVLHENVKVIRDPHFATRTTSVVTVLSFFSEQALYIFSHLTIEAISMALLDIFIGVPQSKYAAIAILVALTVVAIAMLFGKDEVPIGQKFLFIILMVVIALPSVLLSLFQLTCLVTGAGLKNQRWWCGAYAWISTILIMIYSVLIVVVGVIAMVNGTNVSSEMDNLVVFEAMQVEANKQAQEYFEHPDQEDFQAAPAPPPAVPVTTKPTVDPRTVAPQAPPPAPTPVEIPIPMVATTTLRDSTGRTPDKLVATTTMKAVRMMPTANMATPVPAAPQSLEKFADFAEVEEFRQWSYETPPPKPSQQKQPQPQRRNDRRPNKMERFEDDMYQL